MEDFKPLIIGIVGGIIVLLLERAFKAYRKHSILEDIRALEFEKKHLEEMKRSSIEMNRCSFRSIFALSLLAGLANLIPRCIDMTGIKALSGLSLYITVAIWGGFVALSFNFWQRYENIKNYVKAMKKIEGKLEKLQTKLGNS